MNLIVKFNGAHRRDTFVERLREQHPEMLSSYIPAKSGPHAVLENLDESQVAWVRDSVQDLGTVFDDIQFKPFGV